MFITMIFLFKYNCVESDLETPGNLKASQGEYSDHIYVEWDGVSGATVYALKRAPENVVKYFEIYYGDRTFFDDYPPTKDGNSFYYKVAAFRGDEKSKYTKPVLGHLK
jgi:hypothetical protein